MEPIVARMKLRIKSMIWNISKKTQQQHSIRAARRKKNPPETWMG